MKVSSDKNEAVKDEQWFLKITVLWSFSLLEVFKAVDMLLNNVTV